MKQLYFLHIPKTAGRTIALNVLEQTKNLDVPIYINNIPPHDVNFSNKVFISAHFGTYPIIQNPDIDVATVLRDPLDRCLSNFNYLYKLLLKRPEYQQLNGIKERMLFYLLEDPNFILHQNLQTRFLCNPCDESIFNLSDYLAIENRDKVGQYLHMRDWFVPDDMSSAEYAKSQIDSFKIVGTIEKFNDFAINLYQWFNDNYGIKIIHNENIKKNVTFNSQNGKMITTKTLKDMLTSKEYDKILEANSMDMEVYEYVKQH
jgi:hypothetical protein